MRKDKVKQVVLDALTYRGFSESEATQLIGHIAESNSKQPDVSVSRTIDVYA